MATSAEIKVLFKTYFDAFSFNFSNAQLNSIFEKANHIYWDGLAAEWGSSLENSINIQPIVADITVTTFTGNKIALSSITNYDRLAYLKPTYVVNGVTYSFPAKPQNENNRFSPLSAGTLRNPRYRLIADYIVLSPNNTPTTVDITYLTAFPAIDFTTPAVDIPITAQNVQGILEEALRITGNMQREFDYANQITLESNVSKQ
jgi:hypothetical protein